MLVDLKGTKHWRLDYTRPISKKRNTLSLGAYPQVSLSDTPTEYVDHERKAKSNDHRLDSAWFGAGASIKEKALELVGQML